MVFFVVFHSYEFILALLPLSVLLYFLACRYLGSQGGNLILAGVSLIFYSAAGTECLLLLLTGICVNYLFSRAMGRHGQSRLLLTVSVLLNVLLLVYVKYWNFFLQNISAVTGRQFSFLHILLPLGISFYTFQQISYLVCSYRNQLPRHSFLEYGVYILYFPKLVMGPLMEPDAFLLQLQDDSRRSLNSSNLVSGVQIFVLGLFKKVILADQFAAAVNWGFSTDAFLTSADWILISLFYTLQIYFDFSGYSDMASGVSRMFNLDLPCNFNSPYKTYSLREFWKCWHMSLTGFFTKYIYIPLGGSRKGRGRTLFNVFLVFLISGLWHGANWTFLLWGVLNGLICIGERLLENPGKKLHMGFRWVLNFTVINVLWLLFRCESIGQWLHIIKNTISFQYTYVSDGLLQVFRTLEYGVLLDCSSVLAVLPGGGHADRADSTKQQSSPDLQGHPVCCRICGASFLVINRIVRGDRIYISGLLRRDYGQSKLADQLFHLPLHTCGGCGFLCRYSGSLFSLS